MSYDNEYKKLFFLDIGGTWGYAIMHIQDSYGKSKVRLAKCKKKSGFPTVEKWCWQEIDTDHIENLSQVSKINFKKEQEIDICFQKLKEELKELGNDTN